MLFDWSSLNMHIFGKFFSMAVTCFRPTIDMHSACL